MSSSGKKFGELLAAYRHDARLTQRGLANDKLDLSYTFLAMLERGKRGRGEVALRRDQAWYLVRRLKLWPPKCDHFFEAAGLAADRTASEEQDIQRLSTFKELWVFAKSILDPDDAWYDIVRENILKKKVIYRYFTETSIVFKNLLNLLRRSGASEKVLRSHLECTLLPTELFVANFAIYRRSAEEIYCCGAKRAYGKAIAFYTMHESEALNRFEQLQEWRSAINIEHDIRLRHAQRIYPSELRSAFTSLESGSILRR